MSGRLHHLRSLAAATGITRRDVLAAFLGLPVALAGCARPKPGNTFGGEIVGASDALGHRLRDAIPPQPAADRWERCAVLIVGGGVAGLATAWRLLRSGFTDFLLLELENAPGGTARSGTSPVVGYPWGAHYIPAPLKENRLLITLFEEMGLLDGRDADGQPIVAEQYLCRAPKERLFIKGHWYEDLYPHAGQTDEDRRQLARFEAEVDRWVAWRDGRGRPAFALPLATSSDDAEVTALDKLSMDEWLTKRGLTSPRLRWMVNYECRDDYGATLEDTSAWASMFYRTSRKRKVGAESQPYVTWPEGNGHVIKHLYAKAKERVRLGLAVAELVPTDPQGHKGVDAVALDASAGVLGFHADQVVFAAPQFVASYAIRPYRPDPPRHIREFEYGAWMVANLHLKDRPQERAGPPLAWDNVLYDSPSLGYVVATHQRGLDQGPTVFTYYYPFCDHNPKESRTRLLGLDWQACADIALTDLEQAHRDLRPLVERLDVMRWGHAMIRPRPGFVWGGARASAQRPYRGIHFANADLSGVGLFEEAFDHGVRAAEEVLAARGIAVESLR
jgi:protoporphyrinogen oxidase